MVHIRPNVKELPILGSYIGPNFCQTFFHARKKFILLDLPINVQVLIYCITFEGLFEKQKEVLSKMQKQKQPLYWLLILMGTRKKSCYRKLIPFGPHFLTS